MESQCWFYCFPEKLLTDTLHLSPHDFGAYTRALLWYYANGPLPDEEDTLRRIMGVLPDDWARCRGMVMPYFFKNGDGKLHQKRADMEIARRNRIIQTNRDKTKLAREAKVRASTTHVTGPLSLPVSDRISLETELKRLEDRVQVIRGQGDSTPHGLRFTQKQSEELVTLCARKKEILSALGMKA